MEGNTVRHELKDVVCSIMICILENDESEKEVSRRGGLCVCA